MKMLNQTEEKYFENFLKKNISEDAMSSPDHVKTIPGGLTPNELVGVMLPLAQDYIQMTESMVGVRMDQDVIDRYPILIMPEPYYLGFQIEFITDFAELATHASSISSFGKKEVICDYDCLEMGIINPYTRIPMLSITSWLANCELDICPLTMAGKKYVNQLKPLTPSFIKELFNWHKRVVVSGDVYTEEGEIIQEKAMIKIFGKNTPFNHPYFPRDIYRVYPERNFLSENDSDVSIEDIEELTLSKRIVNAVMYPDKGFKSTGDYELDKAICGIWRLLQSRNTSSLNAYYSLLPGKEEPNRNGKYVNIKEE